MSDWRRLKSDVWRGKNPIEVEKTFESFPVNKHWNEEKTMKGWKEALCTCDATRKLLRLFVGEKVESSLEQIGFPSSVGNEIFYAESSALGISLMRDYWSVTSPWRVSQGRSCQARRRVMSRTQRDASHNSTKINANYFSWAWRNSQSPLLNFYYSEYLIKHSIEARAVLNSIFSLIVFGDKIWLKSTAYAKAQQCDVIAVPSPLNWKKFLTGS